MTKFLLLLLILVGLLAGGCKSSQSEGPAAQDPLPGMGGGTKDPRDPGAGTPANQ